MTINMPEFQRQARQARAVYEANVQQARSDPYIPKAALPTELAGLRKDYDAKVANIQANAKAALSNAYSDLDRRGSRALEREAESERKAINALGPAYIALMVEELRGLSPSALLGKLKSARDDGERLAIAKLGAAALRASPLTVDDLTLPERQALTEFWSSTAVKPSAERVALAAEVDELTLASDLGIRELDPVGREEGLRDRYGIGRAPEPVEFDATQELARGLSARSAPATTTAPVPF